MTQTPHHEQQGRSADEAAHNPWRDIPPERFEYDESNVPTVTEELQSQLSSWLVKRHDEGWSGERIGEEFKHLLEENGLPVDSDVAIVRLIAKDGTETITPMVMDAYDFGTQVRNFELVKKDEVEPVVEPEKVGHEVLDVVKVDSPATSDLQRVRDARSLLESLSKQRELPGREIALERIGNITLNGPSGSPLAESLLKAGDSPEAILESLGQSTTEADRQRDAIRSILRTRLQMIIDTMPGSVQRDIDKQITDQDEYGTDHMPSQDYVVEMALKLLQGRFNEAKQKLDGKGVGGIGEHRTAMYALLDDFKQEPEQIKPEVVANDERVTAHLVRLNNELEHIEQSLEPVERNAHYVESMLLEQSLEPVERNAHYVESMPHNDAVDVGFVGPQLIELRTGLQQIREQVSEQLIATDAVTHSLEGADHAKDREKLDAIRDRLRMMVTTLDELYDGEVGSTMMMAANYGDEYSQKLRAFAKRGDVGSWIGTLAYVKNTVKTIREKASFSISFIVHI